MPRYWNECTYRSEAGFWLHRRYSKKSRPGDGSAVEFDLEACDLDLSRRVHNHPTSGQIVGSKLGWMRFQPLFFNRITIGRVLAK